MGLKNIHNLHSYQHIYIYIICIAIQHWDGNTLGRVGRHIFSSERVKADLKGTKCTCEPFSTRAMVTILAINTVGSIQTRAGATFIYVFLAQETFEQQRLQGMIETWSQTVCYRDWMWTTEQHRTVSVTKGYWGRVTKLHDWLHCCNSYRDYLCYLDVGIKMQSPLCIFIMFENPSS